MNHGTSSGISAALEQLLVSYSDLNPARIDEFFSEPTPLEFMRYAALNKPFVLRGGARSWPAFRQWSAAHLVSVMGDSKVNVAMTPDGLADSVMTTPTGQIFVEPLTEDEPFADVLHYITSRRAGEIDGPVKYCQTQNDNLRSEYDALFADVPGTVSFAAQALDKEPDAVNFWLGDEASVTSLHKDNYENIYAQIRGKKHFLLIPPVMAPCMEERLLPLAKWQRTDDSAAAAYGLEVVLEEPRQLIPVPTWDPLRHPSPPNALGKHVKPIHVELLEGDMMYLPAMWYHHVRQTGGIEGFSCSVNYWYDMDFAGQFWSTNSFIREISLLVPRDAP